jgi:hypothetical protein
MQIILISKSKLTFEIDVSNLCTQEDFSVGENEAKKKPT